MLCIALFAIKNMTLFTIMINTPNPLSSTFAIHTSQTLKPKIAKELAKLTQGERNNETPTQCIFKRGLSRKLKVRI